MSTEPTTQDTLNHERRCRRCEKRFSVSVPKRGFLRWQSGEPIQRAMPDVDVDTRELLISGVCGDCLYLLCRVEDADHEY